MPAAVPRIVTAYQFYAMNHQNMFCFKKILGWAEIINSCTKTAAVIVSYFVNHSIAK